MNTFQVGDLVRIISPDHRSPFKHYRGQITARVISVYSEMIEVQERPEDGRAPIVRANYFPHEVEPWKD